MSYYYTHVKRYKRGAKWDDGSARLCTRCGYERRSRKRRAAVTAFLQYSGTRFKVPVGYCEEHMPSQLEGEEE